MKLNFYKLCLLLILSVTGKIAFAQTTIDFESTSYTTGTFYGQNFDINTNSNILRFNYNNASTSGGASSYYMDDVSGNKVLGAFNFDASDKLTIAFTDNSAFSFKSFQFDDFGFGDDLVITGYNGSTQVATYSASSNFTDGFITSNALSQNAAFGNVTKIVITGPNGLYHYFDDFVVQPLFPSVTTSAVVTKTATTATLPGVVNNSGFTTTPSFDYGTSSTLATPTNVPATPSSITGAAANTNVSASITGLSAATLYYYRVKGVNMYGTGTGSILSFTTPSTDATLSALSTTAGAISFASATTSYSLSVASSVSTITVTPTRNESHATIQVDVNGGGYNTVTSGSASGNLSLTDGTNAITVRVTAQDGTTTKDYTLTITRASSNTAPVIGGAVAAQAVNDNSTISPFSALTVTDAETAQTQTVSVTLDAVAKGSFTTLNGFTNAGSGVYTFSGTAANTQTAIRGLVFTPTANRVAPGSTETTTFTVSVNDGVASAVTNAITTVVSTSINNVPTIGGAVASQAVNDNSTITPFSGVTFADADSPAQTQSVSVTLDAAAKGSFTTLNGFTNAGGGIYTYSGTAANAQTAIRGLVFTPTANRVTPLSTETTTFTISITDGLAVAVTNNTSTVVSTSINDAPVAAADTYTTPINAALTKNAGAGLLANDTDPDAGAVLSAVLASGAAHGTLTLNADGSFTYTPGTGYSGSDSFTYKANDGTLNSSTATVSITVSAVEPTVTTAAATTISVTGATLGGNVTADGGATVTDRGVVYATSASPSIPSNQTSIGSSTGSFSQAVSSLSPGTTYYARAYAINSVGTSYGSDQSFTTLTSAPANPTATAVTPTGFTAGWDAVTGASGYELDYSTTSDFSSDITNLTSITTNSKAITGLTSGTNYYFRVRALNSASAVSANSGVGSAATSTIVSSVTANTTNGTYATGSSLSFNVNFSSAVTVTGSPTLALIVGSTTRAATFTSGSGSSTLVFSYTIQAGEADNDGVSLGAISLAGGTIKNAITNTANLTLQNVADLTGIKVDAVAPTVASVSVPADGTYIAGGNLDFTVNTSKAVTVGTIGGTPYIGLTLGTGGTVHAQYNAAASTGSALVFRYTVATGNLDGDGVVLGSSIILNGGTMKDAVGNIAVLTLNSIGSTANVLVDAVAPTVSSVSVPSNGTYKIGDILTFTVNYTEDVTITGVPQVPVTIGSNTRYADFDSGTGSALTFKYTVVSGDLDNDGIAVNAALTLNGGTIKDAAENNSVVSLNSIGTTTGVLVDGLVPTLSAVTIASDNGNTAKAKTGNIVTVTFTSSEAIGTPTVSIAGASATVSGSGTSWSASHTMLSTDAEGTVPFTIAFSDAAGNAGTSVTATTNSSSVTFDKTAPTLSAVTIASDNGNTAKAKTGNIVTVTFTSSETISTPTVTIAGASATVSGSGTSWSASHTMLSTDAEGTVTFTIAFSDAAGNAGTSVTATTNSSSVTFDKTAPTLSAVTIASDNSNTAKAKTGNIVTVTFTSSEAIGTPTVTIAGASATVSGSGTSWSASHTMLSTDAEGTVTFTIAFSDAAGNAGTSVTATTNSSSVTFDKTAPTLSAVTIASDNGNTAKAKTGNIVTVTFTSSETISTPTVTIAGTSATVSGSGTSWSASHTMLSTDAEGTVTFTIAFSDAAGNAGTSVTATTNSSTVSFDKTAPAAPVVITVANGATVITATPVISGTAEANSTVSVYIDGSVVNSAVSVDGSGNWTYTVSPALANNTYAAKAKATDAAGNVSGFSNTNTFTVNTSPSIGVLGPIDPLSSTYGSASASSSFTVSGVNMTTGILVTSPDAFEVSTDDATFSNTVTVGTSGSISQLVYVRLKNTNPADTYFGDITLSSTDASDVTIGIPNSVVSKASATITLTNLTPTYNGAAKAATATTSPVGLTGVSITYDGSSTAPTDAGTYPVVASLSNANYTATNATGSLVIAKAPATISLTDLTPTYDGTAKAATATTTPVGLTGISITYDGSSTAPINAGTYPVVASLTNTNYTATNATGSLVIAKATATITLSNLTPTYNGTAKAATATTNPGGLNVVAITYNGSSTAPSAAGTYPVIASLTNTNYAATNATDNLVIGKASQTITFNPITAITYGDAAPVLTGVSASSGAGVSFTSSNTDVATVSGSTITIVGAGSTTIRASQTGNSNYLAATPVDQTLTVNKKTLTIAANNKGKSYGQTLTGASGSAAFTSVGLVSPQTIGSVTIAYGSGSAAAASATTYTGSVTASLPTGGTFNADNYAISFTAGNIIVDPAALTIKANDKEKTYGQLLIGGSGSTAFTSTGLQNNETIGTVALNYGTGSSTTSAVSTYAGKVTPSFATGGTFTADNYTITYTPGDIVVKPAALIIAASNKAKTYGQAITGSSGSSAFTPTGLQNNETIGSVTISYGTGAAATAAAATYTGSVIASSATGGNFTIGNYNLTYAPGDIIVDKAAVTITAVPKNKIYGDADPEFTYGITSGSLVNGDTFSGTLNRDPGENVGAYNINQGSVALSSNYVLTYIGDKLTIGTKAISIAAAAKAKTYGDADPAFTYSITNGNLVNNDAFTGALNRDAGENTGTYAIRQGALALSNNYALTYTGTNLVIGTRAVAIAAVAKTKTYGDADPALTYSIINGSLAGNDAFSGSLSRDAGENTGLYVIKQGTLTLSTNYVLTYAGANLSIGIRAITVTADAKSKAFNNPDPALTYQVTSGSLAPSDTFAGSLIRDEGESSGTYAIRQGTLALNSNYAMTYVGANFTIQSSVRVITFNALPVKNYGDGDFAPGATISNGDVPVYTSSNTAVATVVNGNIHIVGAGNVTITASAPGNLNFLPATSIAQILIINKANQVINFAAIPNQLNGTKYSLAAVTSSAGLPVTFVTSDPFIAIIQKSDIHTLALGTVTITASVAGNNNYNPAVNVTQTFKVTDPDGNEIIARRPVSPNGDGINDFFYIEGIQDHQDNKVIVINRNGVKIYEVAHYDNAAHVFDGHSNVNGKLQQPGTYFYLIEYTENGVGKRKSGYFILKYEN